MQRLTVIATDSVLIGAAAYALSPRSTGLSLQRSQLGFILVIGHAGLIIVDHMHFQYNGMLLGAQDKVNKCSVLHDIINYNNRPTAPNRDDNWLGSITHVACVLPPSASGPCGVQAGFKAG